MKNSLRRVLTLVLALTLLASLALPASLAEKAAANATSFASKKLTTYTGMKTALSLLDEYNDEMLPGNYKWTTSNKKIVTVSSQGVITAQKPGKAKITATSKSNKKDKATITVTVKKNKVDKIYSKPSAGMIPYQNFSLLLKSVEIASPKKVVVEYYYIQNFPSSWKSIKLNYINDTITGWDTSGMLMTIAGGKLKNIKVSVKGKAVKTVKATYTGAKAKNTNLRLKNLASIDFNHNMQASLQYRRPR